MLPLRLLDLASNFIGDPSTTAMQSLALALGRCTTIQRLDLSFVGLEENGTAHLAHHLTDHPNLQRLELCGNRLSANGLRSASTLLGSSSLRALSLAMTNMTEVVGAFPWNINRDQRNTTLLELNWGGLGSYPHSLNTPGGLIDTIGGCVALTYLSLSQNNIGEQGASELAAALKACSGLRSLDLSNNPLGRKSACRFARTLPNLTDLDLFRMPADSNRSHQPQPSTAVLHSPHQPHSGKQRPA